MPPWFPLVLAAVAGALVIGVSFAALRASGADVRTGRRLAGAPEVRVGSLLDAADPPDRVMRVVGRIRCRDPLHADRGERLVAYHRDVEVKLPGVGWRTVERLRETRSFELWDHDGALTIDPGRAAEPLVSIPSVWRGSPALLAEPHAASVRHLEASHGSAREARAATRTINVTDRLLVLARPVRGADGRVSLEPPPGGYVISTLPLDDAMRLLGGPRRRLAVAGLIGLALGVVVSVASLALIAISFALGR